MIQGQALQKISEMEKRMLAFDTAMSYNFCQLCVKADPSSLLTAEMMVQGDMKHIEDLANVYLHNKERDGEDLSIDLFPKDPEYLSVLSQGMMKAHPEFKQSLERYSDAPDNTDEQDEMQYKFLRLTMPEVNKDRRDILISSIDAIHEVCKVNLDKMYAKCTAELVPVMVGYTPEQIKEVNDSKDKYRDTYKKTMEDLTDQKKQEIEDAYQEYLKTRAEQGLSNGGSAESTGTGTKTGTFNIGQSISL